MAPKEKASSSKERNRKYLTYFLGLIIVGAILMTTSIAISGKNKSKTLFDFENIVIGQNDFKYISRSLIQDWNLSFSYVGNITLNIYLVKQDSFDQILLGNLSKFDKDIDGLKFISNESISTTIQETGDYVLVIQNANVTSSALISRIMCSAEWIDEFEIPSLGNTQTSIIFYVGLMLSLVGVLWFIADSLNVKEKIVSAPTTVQN